MLLARTLLVPAVLVLVLSACKKAEAPPTPEVGGSVAAPANALPPSDATMPAPATGTTHSGDSNGGPTQAQPKELTKEQESSAMPLPGQVNNHSTTDPVEQKK